MTPRHCDSSVCNVPALAAAASNVRTCSSPLDYVLNTPRHHRVHHATNDACLDRNYGNVLIVFDRLFGTFAKVPANEPLRFGLKGRSPSNHPLRIALGEWAFLLADLSVARGLKEKMNVLLSPP